MVSEAFRRFFWGFLLILLDFRIGGFDVLPDVVGYFFFAGALKTLAENSDFFKKAIQVNTVMMFISIVYLYERPTNQAGVQVSTHPLGPLGAFIGFVGFFISLLVVYRIFMGIQEMSKNQGFIALAVESEKRWKQFLFLQFAVLLALLLIFIPPLAVMYILAVLVFNVVFVFIVLGFLKRCREAFSVLD